MHPESLKNMQWFYDSYLAPHLEGADDKATVVDIGSMDVNGTYRQIFDAANFDYVGVDLAAGKGVDVVAKNPYSYPLPDDHCVFRGDPATCTDSIRPPVPI